MATAINDTLQLNAPKGLDNRSGKFVSGAWQPFDNIADAQTRVPVSYRSKGLTQLILKGGVPTEYWYKSGITDNDLIEKISKEYVDNLFSTIRDVSVLTYGADPSFSADSSTAIQDAINYVHAQGGGKVYFPKGRYKTTKPILTYGNVYLIGDGKNVSTIEKSTSTLGTTGNISAPGRTNLNDNYNIDSVISIVHPIDDFAYESRIEGIGVWGSTNAYAALGIYAPRTSRLILNDIYINRCVRGFETHDSWLGQFNDIIIEGGDYGMVFSNDGAGIGTGTSCHINNVWCVGQFVKPFYFFALSYSHMSNLACDNFNAPATVFAVTNGAAYNFDVCKGIIIDGMGVENSKGSVLFVNNGSISISGMQGFNNDGYPGGSFNGYIFVTDNAKVTLNNCTFPVMGNKGNFWDIVIQNNCQVIANNCFLPTSTGGNGRIIQNNSLLIEDGMRYSTSASPSLILDPVNKGIIFPSPDGTMKRLTINNDDSINITVIPT